MTREQRYDAVMALSMLIKKVKRTGTCPSQIGDELRRVERSLLMGGRCSDAIIGNGADLLVAARETWHCSKDMPAEIRAEMRMVVLVLLRAGVMRKKQDPTMN